MNTYLNTINNNYSSYYSYHNKFKHNEQTESPIVCESIFIYTCEPKEQESREVSFKGNPMAVSGTAKLLAVPVLASIGTFAASVLSKFNRKDTHKEDVKRIIQNQKDMEYICALKRNFVPHSEFDKMVLENYNKNLNMLENVNKALISKIVDEVLTKKKFKELPSDYPERIKERAYCLSTWGGDCFTLEEKDVEYFISKLKEEDVEKEKAKVKEKLTVNESRSYFTPKEMETVHLGKLEPGTVLNTFGLNPKTASVRAVIDLLKTETKKEDDIIKTLDDIYKKVESCNITTKEAFDEIIRLLESMKIQPNCICSGDDNSNTHEGIIGIIS